MLALTEQQKQRFDEDGYLLLKQVYSPEQVQEARERLNHLLLNPEGAHPRMQFKYESGQALRPPPPDNPRRIWMIKDTPLGGDWWFRLISDSRILDPVVDCLGPDINFHGGFARVKPPGYRSHQVWHQDWPHDRHTRPELVSALLYLDDTWEGAASTHVVPGSHKLGEWPHNEELLIPDAVVGTPGLPLCAQAGDIALLHVMLVHRAGRNETSQNRSCLISEYKTAETQDRWGNTFAFADMPLRRGGLPFR